MGNTHVIFFGEFRPVVQKEVLFKDISYMYLELW